MTTAKPGEWMYCHAIKGSWLIQIVGTNNCVYVRDAYGVAEFIRKDSLSQKDRPVQ